MVASRKRDNWVAVADEIRRRHGVEALPVAFNVSDRAAGLHVLTEIVGAAQYFATRAVRR
ncbi:hypothetical protein [Pseudonocardia abyssalis]|uniref:Uncharacterized protein n=1 Tax=Pseudonocardia abyssalis TaxID=2792008 RepID=A0ABS6UNS2_9PSEU|nr:hypothetical protein [Pseudonocardia abyssalis]MBW0118467.1 hypothetical protein [Pseudonocardia abyssalis]MBW0133908.1 hypothetical protein [Pseudonocardia abyssalis]